MPPPKPLYIAPEPFTTLSRLGFSIFSRHDLRVYMNPVCRENLTVPVPTANTSGAGYPKRWNLTRCAVRAGDFPELLDLLLLLRSSVKPISERKSALDVKKKNFRFSNVMRQRYKSIDTA